MDRNRARGEDRMTVMSRDYRNAREKEGYEDDADDNEEDYEEDVNSTVYLKQRKLEGSSGLFS